MKKTLLCLALTGLSCSVFAQWSQLPEEGGELRDVTIIPGGLLAASEGGVFKSMDGGSSWVYSSNGLFAADSSISCEHFASTSTALFVQTNNGIAKTTNDGSTWVSAGNIGITSNTGNFSSLVSLGNMLFTCKYSNMNVYQIFTSTNDGENWTPGANVYSNGDRPLLFNKGGIIYVTKEDSIFTTATGASLTPMSYTGFPTTGTMIENLSTDGTYLFAGFQNGGAGAGIYRYDIANTNWQQITTGISPLILSTGPYLIGNTLYTSIVTMSMTIETYTSTNQGTNWGQTSLSGLTINFIQGMYSLGGNNIILYNPGDGLAISLNDGSTWTPHNTGFKSFVYRDQRDLIYSNGNLITCRDLGLRKSNDGGNNWTPAMNGIPPTLFLNFGLYNANNILYTSFMDLSGKYLYKSTDGGANWTIVTYPAAGEDIEFWSHSNTAVFTTVNNSLYRSLNSGGAWTDITANLNSAYNYDAPMVFDGTNLYILGINGSGNQIFSSNNDGDSWTPISMSGIPSGGYIATNIFMNGNTLMSFWLDPSAGYSYKMCTYTGSNWTSITTTGIPPNLVSSCLSCGGNGTYENVWFTNSSNIYFMSNKGLFMSTDNGTTFAPYNNGFYPGVITKRLTTDGVKLYAATEGNSIWSIIAPLGLNTFVKAESVIDIYPNPAINKVVIKYNEDISGANSKLIITDMLGAIVQEVALLAGTTQTEVSTVNLKNGIYFYTVSSSSKKSETKKIIINK
jgi:photosystem II stability/assembly factor-like uncharacterized protein